MEELSEKVQRMVRLSGMSEEQYLASKEERQPLYDNATVDPKLEFRIMRSSVLQGGTLDQRRAVLEKLRGTNPLFDEWIAAGNLPPNLQSEADNESE